MDHGHYSLTSNIRSFRSTDQRRLIATIDRMCFNSQWMETSAFQPTTGWRRVFKRPDCKNHLLLVAEPAQEVAGWCRAFPTGQPGEAEVGIGILPPYQNEGVGSAMLQQTIQWAGERGVSRLTLITHKENSRALHVFHKAGFTLTGNNRGDWLEMACIISYHHEKESGRP